MATDWQPVSLLIGRTGGIANRMWYQNFRLSAPPVVPPSSFQVKIFMRSRDNSPESLHPLLDRLAIVVTFGSSFVAITIVCVASDDNCFRTAPTFASFQTLPNDVGLKTTITLRLDAAWGLISRLPEKTSEHTVRSFPPNIYMEIW